MRFVRVSKGDKSADATSGRDVAATPPPLEKVEVEVVASGDQQRCLHEGW